MWRRPWFERTGSRTGEPVEPRHRPPYVAQVGLFGRPTLVNNIETLYQCTPCRNGTEKAVKLMSAGRWDADILADLSQVMADASICGLGQAAPNPIRSVLRYFPEDLR